MPEKNIANNFKMLRIINGWSQQQAANRLHVDQRTISTWEKGHACPSLDQIIAICDLFRCTVDDLVRRSATVVLRQAA